MKMKQYVVDSIAKTKLGNRIVNEQRYRIILTAVLSLCFNLCYALFHGVVGILQHSWWFIAMCAYYSILGTTRFAAVLCERKNNTASNTDSQLTTEIFVMRTTGILLLLLSCVLAGVNYISLAENIAIRYGTILMITIATYTFTKLTMAIIRAVKQRHNPSPLLAAIRSIGYAEVAVSILTLQRSMLVSFEGMTNSNIYIMNALTGAAVCLFICIIGMMLIKRKENNNGYIEISKNN